MSYVKLKIKHYNNLEAIANCDPRPISPKTIVADYPLGGAPSLLFTKSVGGCIVSMALLLLLCRARMPAGQRFIAALSHTQCSA